MIIKGRSRSGADELATHLMRVDTNEHLEVLEVRGTVASDVRGALREMMAVAAGTRCKSALYHASINVRADERMTREQWQIALDRLENRLGLSGHARMVVMHEKKDREHVHVVWSRIDVSRMAAVSDSFNYRAHEEVARELEKEFQHEHTQGAHVEREGRERPARTRSHQERQQAERTGIDADRLTAIITEAWRATVGGQAFAAALTAQGLIVARGDRRQFVVIDPAGGVHSLARRIDGVRTAELRARMVDVALEALPNVIEARAAVLEASRTATAQAALTTEVQPASVLEKLLRTRPYVTEDELVGGLQDAGINDAARAFAQLVASSEVVALRERGGAEVVGYTTATIRRQEAALLSAATALASSRAPALAVSGVDAPGVILSDEQERAARHAMSGARLSMIIGRAGTGKSATLSAIREAAQRAGAEVIALAPTNTVVQDLRDRGFDRAGTVHSLLWHRQHAPDHPAGKVSANAVIIVDEAAMLDTARLTDLVTITREAGSRARLVLVGDDRQLASIERGGMFHPIAEAIGAATLTEVHRQARHWSRRASEAFAQGRFRDGLEAFADRGWLSWSSRLSDSRNALLARYERDTAEERGKRFIFAYTNEEVRRLNDAVQAMEIERGRVGELHTFETARGTLRVGEGDRVMIRATDKKRGLYNGALATVQKIDGDTLAIRTDRGKALSVDLRTFNDIELGYAGTIYRGQGKTLDDAYLLHTRHWRDASSYVALTRARHTTQVFIAREEARDLDDLACQMARQNNRAATIEFEAVVAGAEVERLPAEKAAGQKRRRVRTMDRS
jgi:hypothetical protein